jgi:hypothetical protein
MFQKAREKPSKITEKMPDIQQTLHISVDRYEARSLNKIPAAEYFETQTQLASQTELFWLLSKN